MSTPPQPGYGYPQQPYGQQPPPPAKPGMSTGKKIALGCGIPTLLGLILVGGCTALVGKAADDVSKELDKSHDSAVVGPSGSAKAGDTSKAGEPDITKDLNVASCAVKNGEYGLKELDVKIEYTNSGDRRFTYFAEGEVLLNGEKKADLISTASNLAPGQKYTDDSAGALAYDVAKAVKPGDKLECKVVKVSRSAF
ncbi:hypothetical protein OG625_36985 [Streptomyces sp. NBC_01351]|uniref:hypothetical protein n=1 Tax=Streptomyces sp. NBC_01351 TaxID=2903833 RepID=UPI002E37E713|nr:hypothetical protein [Streptomyces sp. NBC_01351]